VNADLQAALPAATRIGLVVGGGVRDPMLDRAAIILGEYREQLQRCFPKQLRARRAMVLPKWVDLDAAGDGTPPEAPDFDIVNVGSFAEPRKNQAALLPLAGRHRIAFVGGGPLLEQVRRAAPDGGRAQFLGRLPQPQVFATLRRAAIMAHTSTMDGLPRATVEAMACGLPVVAFRSTIDGGIPAHCGVLTTPEALRHAVDLLLTDAELRRRMGRAARRHAETHHGAKAIDAAAGEALAILRN